MSLTESISRRGKIGLITCKAPSIKDVKWDLNPRETEPKFTPDDLAVVDALRRRGFEVEPVSWGTGTDQLKREQFDLLVMRSAWDYMNSEESRKEFAQWLKKLRQAEIKVQNPPDFMLWNLDKHYLKDMEKAGIQVVPTTILEPDEEFDPAAYVRKNGDIIVKPCIGAGGRDTFRISYSQENDSIITTPPLGKDGKDIQAELDRLREGRSFIVQPFLREISTQGEWSLIFLNGEYSHSLLKKPSTGNFLVQERHGGSVTFEKAPDDVIAAAKEAYSKISDARGRKKTDLLYARVDVAPTQKGNYVMEVEGTEPELFFRAKPGSEEQFCTGIENKIAQSRTK